MTEKWWKREKEVVQWAFSESQTVTKKNLVNDIKTRIDKLRIRHGARNRGSIQGK